MQLLEQRIVEHFHLYEGLRDHTEDVALHAAIYEQCLFECGYFLEQELQPEESQQVAAMFEAVSLVDSHSETFRLLLQEIGSHLSKKPDLAFKLEQRLIAFVQHLAASSILRTT